MSVKDGTYNTKPTGLGPNQTIKTVKSNGVTRYVVTTSTKKVDPYAGGKNFESGTAKQFNLGDFIKTYASSIPLKFTTATGQVIDYTKTNLTYTPQGTTIGVTPSKAHFLDSINEVFQTNPALGQLLLDHFNLNQSPSSTNISAAWSALEKTGFNLGKTASPQVTSLKNALAYEAKLNADQTAAGIRSATAGQQANAIDNVHTTIESWNYTPAQKKYIGDLLGRLVTVNGDHIVNQNALLDIFRGNLSSGLGKTTDAKIKKDYNEAFPGLNDYNSQPGAVHMNESQYTQYSTQLTNSATQYGAPMLTQDQIGQLLTNHVSPVEYNTRLTDIYSAVSNANQSTKNLLRTEYGINNNDLMHYMITGSLPDMQRKIASAEIQDYASRVGLTGLTQGDTGQLANMAKLSSTAGNNPLGVGVSNVQNALLAASKDIGLTKAAPGATTPTVSTNQLIGSQLAGFAGTNQAVASRQVQLAEEAKAAPFEKGGGYDVNAKGVVGLGSART